MFANMKRVSTGLSRVVTPLFDNMLVPTAKEVGLIQDDVQSISIPTKPSTSKPHKKHKPKKQQTQAPKVPSSKPLPEHRLPSPSNDPLPGGKDSLKLKELIDLCTHFSNKVLELESEVIDIKYTYKERIEKLEGRVDRLKEQNRVLKELHGVYFKVDTAAPVVEKEKSFKHGRIIADIHKDDVDDEEPAKVKEVLEVVTAAKLITKVVTTAKATTTAEATKVSVPRRRRGVIIQDPKETTSTVIVHSESHSKDKGKELNADINWNATIEQVKRNERLNDAVMNEIRPLFEKHYNYNQDFLDEVNEEVTVPEKEVKVEEATPLASKIPIVDYKIHLERNKPYFKIIRADEDHLAKFHKMADAKEMWEAIKLRFGGNDESKKMQQYLLKQQFEGFSMSTSKGLHKGVFERDVKGTTVSSSNTQNMTFVSGNNTSSTNDINDDDMKKMDLKWQVAMISMRIKKFHKRTRRKLQFDTKDLISFDKTKVECFNCHKMGHFARDYRAKGNQDSRRRDVGYNGNKTRDNGRRPAY
uniref:Ribonuclease H-like domain-containing protein n=1 Tax=Tanacetum cinerariifolium TaxID=118510 RepID=A0A6L2P306_TANCI|nr:ribonuclease H-like domain-containing protein [Tanacetum cinerariifolium]